MHTYLFTFTLYSLHIVHFQKYMNTSEKNNENHVKINGNSGTIHENK
jgi:hypothetical protein